MRYSILTFFLLSSLLTTLQAQPGGKSAVSEVLDNFHDAASQADGDRYFAHFAPDGIFLGTDIKERWTLEEFKAYALPYFRKGQGWTYQPKSRHIYLSQDGKTAWFDEILLNEKFGETRGSGVLIDHDGVWKLSQYHLTLPVPNEIIEEVVKMIERQPPAKGN
jgi:SnoaL-like domain